MVGIGRMAAAFGILIAGTLTWPEKVGRRSRGGMLGGAEEVVLDDVWLADLLSGRVMNVGYTGDGPFGIPVLVRSPGTAIN
jgi:hypothetical protein